LDAEKIYTRSASFNAQAKNALETTEGEVKEIEKLMEDQEELKLEKYEFIADKTEKAHKRNESLIERIEKDTKRWESKYKKIKAKFFYPHKFTAFL
jgi:hypothetical protein